MTATARWYVLNVTPGSENSVAKSIRETVAKNKMEEDINEVIVPSEEVVEVRRGQRVTADRKFFPGYIMIKMIMTDEAWHLVNNIYKVNKFLGTARKPLPLSEKEAERMMRQVQQSSEGPRNILSFEVGDRVRVREGAFESFEGTVEGVDEGKERITVSISIFGRATPTELEYGQVEKLT